MHTRVRSRVASACLCSPNRTLSRCLSSIQVQVDSLGLETMERIVDIFDAQLTDQAAAMEIYDTLSKVLVSLVSSTPDFAERLETATQPAGWQATTLQFISSIVRPSSRMLAAVHYL